MTDLLDTLSPEQKSLVGRLIGWVLGNRLVVLLVVLGAVVAGILVAPFDWNLWDLPRSPVPTDAIPDIGENQQIVFTEWMGRSPQDVEDQVTYPLTTVLLGVPGVKTIRSYSMFGFSSIYIIFKENVDFYWSRGRVLEKLNSLPAGTLPPGVQAALGPDATGLGQVFWYTLEGRDLDGRPTGGWDLEELRTIQDWTVRYHLTSADGVAEVASIGGFQREYQVDVDPDAMRAYGVTIDQVSRAVQAANLDVGAEAIEINRVEYFVRSVGFIKHLSDIEESVVAVHESVPVLVKQVATVSEGPALRGGALDKEGVQAVGGVVVARYGSNPLAAIKNVKQKIADIAPGLPAKVLIDSGRVTRNELVRFAAQHGFEAYQGDALDHAAWIKALRDLPPGERPPWANVSQVTIVPFYDRTGLIYETLGTLDSALAQEILITLIVVLVMAMHLRSSVLVGGMMPLAVLLCFIAMRVFGVDANIVALSGIAIAIGTIVDMGIVICENILRHLAAAPENADRKAVIHRAASEVGSAVLTAVSTTVVSFLPVFFMIGAEGKLFKPLAFTKTFALIASIVIALTVIPPAALSLLGWRAPGKGLRWFSGAALLLAGLLCGILVAWWIGVIVALPGLYLLAKPWVPAWVGRWAGYAASLLVAAVVVALLAVYWEPLGPERGLVKNVVFVGGLMAAILGFFWLFQLVYPWVLRMLFVVKVPFLLVMGAIVVFGAVIWLGWAKTMGRLPDAAAHAGLPAAPMRAVTRWVGAEKAFPGLGKEFMPPLDEGSYLFMPTTMVHASIGEALDILQHQDMAISAIPEIEEVVGKIGRVESALDPAPTSMIETVVNYKSEYVTDPDGHRRAFRYDEARGEFVRNAAGDLIADPKGRPYRQWRPEIHSPDDIWQEILRATEIPGATSAPRLQPIAARIVMLQSGMRAPMGVKVKGPDLETIEQVGIEIEGLLKQVPGVEPSAVVADRIVGKPYLEIVPDRVALARYGVPIQAFQDVVEVAIGGRRLTTTVMGRERFGVRVRYARELRDTIETLGRILIPADDGAQIPLEQVADIRYVRGPQMIKSEDTFKTGYVVFDKKPDQAEVDVVEACQAYLGQHLKVPRGVSYEFAGSYQNQVRSQKTLALVLPGALFLIFIILYFQFKSVPTTLLVFSGIFVAWSGGFILLWLYAQPWFLDFSVFGVPMRGLFQVHPINLSVAVWVGFLALFGIASDDGVVMSTYLDQSFRRAPPDSVKAIRAATLDGAKRRIRPCLMTTATTILALIPVMTSTGRGSDVMVPMAIPSLGGMLLQLMTMFIVPVLYATVREFRLHTRAKDHWVGAFVFLTAMLGFFAIAVYCSLHEVYAWLRAAGPRASSQGKA